MILKQHIYKFLWLYPLVLFIVNVLTKLLYLSSQDIGLDEPFSVYHAQFDVGTVISQLKQYNNPPLFELLLHYWIRLFGIAPLSLRVFPLIFASVSPVALFYFGKRFFSLSAGITASLLLSASSLLMYYAHDCRAYSLFLLLSILSMHFFLAIFQEQGKRITSGVLFILLSSLLLYTHYFGAFILGFQGFYLSLFYREYIKKFYFCYLLIVLLYSPHIFVLVERMGYSVSHGTWLSPPAGFESLYNMLWSFSNAPVITVACITLLVAALIKGTKNKDMPTEKTTVLICTWFLFSYFGMFFLSYKVPMYLSRYLIFVLPAYYLLLAICIDYLFKNGLMRKSAFLILIVSFFISMDWSPDKKQRISEGVALIKKIKDANTLVLVSSRDFLPAFAYHYNRAYFSAVDDKTEYHLTDSLLKADNVYVVYNDSLALNGINTSGYDKIIYFANGEEPAGAGSPVLKPLANTYAMRYHRKLNDVFGISVLVRK